MSKELVEMLLRADAQLKRGPVEDTDIYKEVAAYYNRWERGEKIQSIVMGGISNEYEYVIQTLVFRMLYGFLYYKIDPRDWDINNDQFKKDIAYVEKSTFVAREFEKFSPSGAQYGAIISLSSAFYMRGIEECLKEQPHRLVTISNQAVFETIEEAKERRQAEYKNMTDELFDVIEKRTRE